MLKYRTLQIEAKVKLKQWLFSDFLNDMHNNLTLIMSLDFYLKISFF